MKQHFEKVVMVIAVIVLLLVWTASVNGWGLPSEDREEAKARSVRSGSLHVRRHSAWGFLSGK